MSKAMDAYSDAECDLLMEGLLGINDSWAARAVLQHVPELLNHTAVAGPISAASLVKTIAELSDAFLDTLDQRDAARAELAALRADVDAANRLFGGRL